MTDTDFKIGWVYEAEDGNEFLVHHIWNDSRHNIIIASDASAGEFPGRIRPMALDKNGKNTEHGCFSLILSTGRKWEREE